MTTRFSSARAVLTAASTLVLAACAAVGPDYKRPEVALPANYTAAAVADPAPKLAADWWTLYADPTLNAVVSATLANNVDLRRALAQIEAADAVLSQASAAILPQIDLNGSASRARSIATTSSGTFPIIATTHRLTLTTSFELDFWGKLRRATEAAQAQALGTRYARDVIALTLASTASQAYFTLRALDAQILVSQSTLRSREEALDVSRRRANAGLVSDLDVRQAEAALADVSLQLREQRRQRALLEHQLGQLTGQLDFGLPAAGSDAVPQAVVPPAGLPASLVERRPDVQQAEQALIAANARIGVARAAQLPTFSLTGLFGGQSAELGNLLNSGARVWSIGPSVSFPVFDAGLYAARTREAEAQARASVAAYEGTVQTAFREVADALSNVAAAAAATTDQQRRVDAAREVLRLSQRRYEAGYSAYLEVLDAQRSLNAAEQGLIQNRQAQLNFSVDLMKALGGGWTPGAYLTSAITPAAAAGSVAR